MMTSTAKALMTHEAPPGMKIERCCNKISIIGAGSVGTAIAFALLAKKITSELVLIDQDESLARGEMLDIQHATLYLDSPLITSSTDYEDTEDSKICIITAGSEDDGEDKKEQTAQRNTKIFKEIISQIVKYSPNSILIIVTPPVDIMTFVAWKLSGFPPYRVIGSGTILESARFRYLVSERLGVAPEIIQAFIIGEQGKHSVPVWSSVTISGVRLKEVNQNLGTDRDPEDWNELFLQVVDSAREVVKLKKCASWGLSLSVAKIIRAILQDSKECFPVSTHVKGCRHGVEKDVYMSLPCVLGGGGVEFIVRQSLCEKEKELLQLSADSMNELQKKLDLTTTEK